MDRKKVYYAISMHKKAGATVLISEQIGFKTKSIVKIEKDIS